MHDVPISGETVVASATYTSDGISLSHAVSGFSLYYEITGDGSADFFYYASVDGENFVREDRAIKRGLTKTSGPGGDGKGVLYIPVMPCNSIKIEVVESGGSNSIIVTAKLASRIGPFGDVPVYDGISSATNIIDYAHHEIHSGSSFTVHVYDVDFDGAEVISVSFKTPDTSKWFHCLALVGSSTASTFEIGEGSTVTAGSGSAYTIKNRNRNSTKASSAVDTAGTPVANTATLNGTITNIGTVIHGEGLGGGKNQSGGGGVRDADEYILKQDTVYSFRLTNGATANGVASMEITWYEHTNR